MYNAIWAIFYDLPEKGRKDYLSWFHEVHIPKALSRAGYLWAAHYAAAYPGDIYRKVTEERIRSNDPALECGAGYVALFGGESTRTFFEPSPTQLKQDLDAKSRDMVALRVLPLEYIYTVEWRTQAPESQRADSRGTPGPVIQMGKFDSPNHDEDVGVWYATERMVDVSRLPGCIGGRKLLAAVGPQKHGVLYDFISLEAREAHFVPLEVKEPTRKVHRLLVHPPGFGSPFIGTRIWPST